MGGKENWQLGIILFYGFPPIHGMEAILTMTSWLLAFGFFLVMKYGAWNTRVNSEQRKIRKQRQVSSVQFKIITCLHSAAAHPTLLKVVDFSGANKAEEQPSQPEQGTQAASLLVSMAMSNVWGGFPILALTMYVGLCMICLPEAMGTMDLRATKLSRNWTLVMSLACIWSTLSSHESGFGGLNGEHGLNTWNTCRVEPWSWESHLG